MLYSFLCVICSAVTLNALRHCRYSGCYRYHNGCSLHNLYSCQIGQARDAAAMMTAAAAAMADAAVIAGHYLICTAVTSDAP